MIRSFLRSIQATRHRYLSERHSNSLSSKVILSVENSYGGGVMNTESVIVAVITFFTIFDPSEDRLSFKTYDCHYKGGRVVGRVYSVVRR